MASAASFRSMRLRPAIWTGRHASASTASMNLGQASAQSHECMQPIEVPTIRRRWLTPSFSTSRLRSKEDLFAIASYGFRGEALPSMAAVSRFSLLTCEPGARRGTRTEVEGGSPAGVTDAGAPAGTTVEVRDLFWNIPARRKFLRKAQTEQAQCVDAVLRLALPRPDV